MKNNLVRNRKILFSILFLFLFFFFSLNFIKAAPPFQIENTFMTIDYTKEEVYQQNQPILFNFFVTNTSTGLRLTNSSVSCQFSMFNHQGNQIITNMSSSYHIAGADFENNILGGNFSQTGDYSFHVYCFSATAGGSLSAGFIVTPTGKTQTTTFLWIFLAIIALTMILGIAFENNSIVFFGFLEILFFGFFILIYGIDIFKDVTTTRAIGFIVWGIAIIGMYKAGEGMLQEGFGK